MCTGFSVSGLAGSLMSQICPSSSQAAAALLIAMNTVMSWQPGTVGVVGGVAMTLAVSGAFSGTSTIEIFRNGDWQFGPELPGYDEM